MPLPQEYLDAINKIEQKILNHQPPPKLVEIRKCFQEIASKFTMLPQHWIQWARLEKTRDRFNDFDERQLNFHLEHIQSQALSCFYHKDLFLINRKMFENIHSWEEISEFHNRLFDHFYFATSESRNEKLFTSPHKYVKWLIRDYDRMSLKPISPKIMEKHQKAVEFYESIKLKSIEEYAHLLPEVDFAIECIEWELGKNPLSKDFWKFYINFLQNKSQLKKDLLNVYSRYCRLFIYDKNMRNEYLVEIKKLDDSLMDVTKWWIDYIGIEKHFGCPKVALYLLNVLKARKAKFGNTLFSRFFENVSSIFQILNQSLNSNYPIQSNLSLDEIDIPRTTFLNVKIDYTKDPIQPKPSNIKPWQFKKYYLSKNQNLSLPNPIMNYIYDFANNHLKYCIFFQTCKFLFYQRKQIFCHNLSITTKCKTLPTFIEHSLYLHPKHFDKVKLKNYRIKNLLKIRGGNSDLISKIIKTINCSEIKYIMLHFQTITLKELNLLPCNQINYSELIRVTITDTNAQIFLVEDLLPLFPNATTKIIITDNFAESSSKNLSKIHFPVKLIDVVLYTIPETFDSNDFVEFLKVNVKDFGRIYLKFHPTTNNDFQENFQINIKDSLPWLTVVIDK